MNPSTCSLRSFAWTLESSNTTSLSQKNATHIRDRGDGRGGIMGIKPLKKTLNISHHVHPHINRLFNKCYKFIMIIIIIWKII